MKEVWDMRRTQSQTGLSKLVLEENGYLNYGHNGLVRKEVSGLGILTDGSLVEVNL